MPGINLAPLIAAAALSPADASAIDRTVAEIFAPYSQPENTVAAWERPIYSREVTELIAKWQSVVPEDEPDALNDGDWLCQCQDWDNRKFRVRITSRKPDDAGGVEVAVEIDIGWGEVRDAFMAFRRENGRWVLDDLYSEEHSDGIKAALRETIREDEALQEHR